MNDKYMEALEQYGLDVVAVRRGRGSWLCDTSQGLKLLREYKGTVKRLEFEESVMKHLIEGGNACVDQYLRNAEGNLISIAGDGTKYILKQWYEDRECNLKDSEEIMWAVAQIAAMHKVLKEVEFKEEWTMGSITSRPLAEEMDRHNRELKRARTYIRNKRKKTEFELCVMGNFNAFYAQAEEALQGLSQLQAEYEHDRLFLCHGDLNQHHILIGEQYIAITEFNRMHLGIQMEDLYHFMRKVMEKHDWDVPLGLNMLNAYEEVLPLDALDHKCLYYLFLYPEKYWKQINFYYNANKAWIPARNIEKLKNLEQQQESRERFLSKIK
ncbi:spore coat protein CotS [Clostridium sp. chh4-2]|uniref:spore coat protein CotS n=1 Tax=Clostridium sp. chh4-2 TaxID=2067550 RepID=UPI000CCE0806|nr:spore coat protein CotS [Clostridium sp. chh4-2]PNV60097.1 spore coat protein CotS [Clostridium sp. chh4-2]